MTDDPRGENESDRSVAELEARLRARREALSATLHDIKAEVKADLHHTAARVEEKVTHVRRALDWREQFHKRPFLFTAAAVLLGLRLGFRGGRRAALPPVPAKVAPAGLAAAGPSLLSLAFAALHPVVVGLIQDRFLRPRDETGGPYETIH